MTHLNEHSVKEGVALCWTLGMLLELLQQLSQGRSQMCTNAQTPSMKDAADTECVGGVSVFSLSLSYLWQAETGLHADFVETLILFQDVCQSQSGGRSGEFFQSWDGLLLKKHNIRNCM